jgi:hypothetical protein
MRKPNISLFVAVLETLGEQGFIDVEPTEGNYDLTKIYDFLVISGIAERTEERYWLRLLNEDACLMLAHLLKDLSKGRQKNK